MWVSRPYEKVWQNFVGGDALIAPHDRHKNAFSALHQRQRRRSRDDPFDRPKKEILRDRVVKPHKLAQDIARREMKEPEVPSGSFGYFSSCWEK